MTDNSLITLDVGIAPSRYKVLNNRYILDTSFATIYLRTQGKYLNVSCCSTTKLFIASHNAEYFDTEASELANVFETIYIQYTSKKMFDQISTIVTDLGKHNNIIIDVTTGDRCVFDSAIEIIEIHSNVTGIVVSGLDVYQQAAVCACKNITNIAMDTYMPAIIGLVNITKLAIRTPVNIESRALFAIISASNIQSLEINLMYTDTRNDISDFIKCILNSKVTDLALDTKYDYRITTAINNKLTPACLILSHKLKHLHIYGLSIIYDHLIEFLQTKLMSFNAYDLVGDRLGGSCFNDEESANIIRILSLNTTMIDFPILSRFLPATKTILERNKKLQFHVVSKHIVDISITMSSIVDEPYLLLEIILWTQPGYELLSRKFFVDIILHTLASIRSIR